MSHASLLRRLSCSLALAIAAVSTAAVADPPKIAFIYAATARDGGWNEALDNAREAVESSLQTDIAVVESVPEEATALKNAIGLLVGRGFDTIVGTTFGYSDGILQAAEANPEISFLNASGSTNAGNLEGFYARTYQGWYLAGMAAAGSSESGRIGIVAGFPVGVVNWDVNAYALGAQAIDPEIDVTVVYTNSWWDPVKEGEVSKALLDQGIDVLANNLSSAAPFIAAEAVGAKSIGFQLDMAKHAPDGMLTSVMFNWDEYLVPTLEAIAADDWSPSEWGAFPGMQEGVVSLAPMADSIPEEVRARIDAAATAIEAGDLSPFDGPVVAQDGTEVVAAGETMDDAGLWNMEFLVRGVNGSVQ